MAILVAAPLTVKIPSTSLSAIFLIRFITHLKVHYFTGMNPTSDTIF